MNERESRYVEVVGPSSSLATTASLRAADYSLLIWLGGSRQKFARILIGGLAHASSAHGREMPHLLDQQRLDHCSEQTDRRERWPDL